ncbi:MAG: LysR family transcriptional regulator [Solirubrobacteraceae bacterium]
MELAQWRLFLAVADEGSLGRAAVRLGTDQPALSRAARRLELTVGTPLFIRSPTGTALTTAGAGLLEQARNLVAAADALDSAAVSFERRGTTRALRVGVLDFHPFPFPVPRSPSPSPAAPCWRASPQCTSIRSICPGAHTREPRSIALSMSALH